MHYIFQGLDELTRFLYNVVSKLTIALVLPVESTQNNRIQDILIRLSKIFRYVYIRQLLLALNHKCYLLRIVMTKI